MKLCHLCVCLLLKLKNCDDYFELLDASTIEGGVRGVSVVERGQNYFVIFLLFLIV